MKYRYLSLLAAGALAVSAWPAFAQHYPQDYPQGETQTPETYPPPETTQPEAPPPTTEEPSGAFQPETPEEEAQPMVTEQRPRTGLGLSLGGGVMNYANNQLRNQTNVGGAWDARLIFGTRSPVAVEAAYQGSAQGIDTLGVSNNAILLSNGVTGKLRVNFTRSNWQPFVTAGAGWRRFSVTNTNTNTSDLRSSDDILEVPVAAGLAYHAGGFLADIRGGYNFAFLDNFVRNPSTPSTQVGAGLDNWQATLSVGVEF